MKTLVKLTVDASAQFPMLAKSTISKVTVLFANFHTGTVVDDGDSGFNVGNHSDTWPSVFLDGCWDILPPGTVVTIIQ